MISFPLSFYVPKTSLFSLIFVTHFANEKLTFDIADSSSFLPINFALIFFLGPPDYRYMVSEYETRHFRGSLLLVLVWLKKNFKPPKN